VSNVKDNVRIYYNYPAYDPKEIQVLRLVNERSLLGTSARQIKAEILDNQEIMESQPISSGILLQWRKKGCNNSSFSSFHWNVHLKVRALAARVQPSLKRQSGPKSNPSFFALSIGRMDRSF
jgi:hypothetical protein